MTNTKCKNDKNWENWERIREQKLEKMKSICFDSYRQSKRDKYFQSKPKPKCLDPSWYTDNIYSNRSMDEDDIEDYVPECVKYGTWKRRLRNIREQDEQYFDGEGESRQHSPSLHRASSYNEFNFSYPKSKSCCFGTKSSSSAKTHVPKSYSFSATTKTKPFDVIDYEPPPPTKRDRRMMRSMMMDNNFHPSRPIRYSRERFAGAKCYSDDIHHHQKRRANRGVRPERPWRYQSPPQACDEYCFRRQQIKRRPCSFDEDFYNCRYDPYETDLDHFIRDERERLMSQDKFLDEDERYLQQTPQYRPVHNKSMLEVRTCNKYDEEDYDSCSESTEIDLQDFNFDLEKYWEELEKPPSPIDLDMQERNMNKNLKVKNVNVGMDCYNNGRPIALHDREHERMMIKKSLLEGMPSPPQEEEDDENHFGVFASAPSPFHRSHKVYPETIPNYKYNNFYSSDECDGSCSNAQPQPQSSNSALSLINNIFSIYKPNKYSPVNCQLNNETKPCKKMNVPSTIRPLGCVPHPTLTSDFMPSMKRPLIISSEHPHFKIIPEKTGLKISPLYRFEFGDKSKHKLTSTARPLLFPH